MHHYVKRGSLLNSLKATYTYNRLSASFLRRADQGLRADTARSLAAKVREFNEKTVVMTVTAGRTGTDTLSKICGLPQGVMSEHEAMPDFRFVMQYIQDNAARAGSFFSNVKVPTILEQPVSAYVESSHLYCKGFFEASLALGYRPNLVFLMRPAHEIALSFLRKDCVPGRTSAGKRFAVQPHRRNFLPIRDHGTLTDYQLCYWYALEIESRQKIYLQVAENHGLVHATIQTKQLNDPDACMTMLGQVGLANADEIVRLKAEWKPTAHNSTPEHKKTAPEFDTQAEQEEVHSRLGSITTVQTVMDRIAAIPTP